MMPRKLVGAISGAIALVLAVPDIHAATSYRPGQAFLRIEQQPKFFVQAGVNLALMSSDFEKSLLKANKKGTKVKASPVFVGAQDASNSVLQVSFSAVIRASGLKVNCSRILISFAVPAQPVLNGPNSLVVQERDRQISCRYSNDLAKALLPNLNAYLDEMVTDKFRELNGQISASIADAVKGNKDLELVFRKTLVAGSICTQFGAPHFCLTVVPAPGVAELVMQASIASAPKPSGLPVERSKLETLIAATTPMLPRKKSTRIVGYTFPSSIKADGTPDDGDLAISGGLICRGGDDEGCKQVQNSQGPDGAFWRSPDRVGLPSEDPKSATFSGDQFKGVALALARTGDGEAFDRWLKFIAGTRGMIPDARSGGAPAYRSCKEDPSFVCVLSSDEWATLALLARRLGRPSDALPEEVRGEPYPYGWSPKLLEWQALANEVGYQLHLIGVQVLLLRELGVTDDALSRASAVLAARQPHNPFYLYLHAGRDKIVSDRLLEQCQPDVLAPLKPRFSWVWQHESADKRWGKDPMIWDCQFVARLLVEDALTASIPKSRTLSMPIDQIFK